MVEQLSSLDGIHEATTELVTSNDNPRGQHRPRLHEVTNAECGSGNMKRTP